MSLRIVVTRGERFDVVEWTTEPAPPRPEGERPPPPAPEPFFSGPRAFVIAASLAIIAATALLIGGSGRPAASRPLAPTVADLQAVHAGVTAAGGAVRGPIRRLSVGDVVETDADGRARLRLDDGTAIVIDRDTRLSITEAGVDLARGRIYIQGAPGARAEIATGGATAILSGADAGVERSREDAAIARIYAPRDELTVRAKKGELTVHAGETASVRGEDVTVAPAKGFDDWTGGMATPWAARGAPRRAVGELWGRSAGAGEPGSPLTIRSHDVRARVTGELAETEVRTTFFNGGSDAVTGDFRMAVPPGAIVSGFATMRGDVQSEGSIALAARQGTQLVSPEERLEWAGEGWLRGSIPGIAPGATVTVIVRYAEWLSPTPRPGADTLVVQYRYPMVSDGAPPLIGEFSARVDATGSQPRSVGAGFGGGAAAVGPVVEIRRPDFRPTADLVVDVEIPAWKAPARLYVASPDADDDEAGATVLVRTEAPRGSSARSPQASDEGVTLALLLDTSASTEPALLDAVRALAAAIVGSLGPRDRVVVLAADQGARVVGPELGPADPARRKAITDALDTLAPGGATDLGRALEAAADALVVKGAAGDPAASPDAMVIYVGDGWPTVGDGTAAEMLARLSRRRGGAPRLGAVAVGPLANRLSLAALTRGSGPLLEMADATDAPRVAVTLLADALQPALAGVELDLGPGVERIYPRGARAVELGETIAVVGRVRGEPPTELTIRWRDAQGAHEEKRPLDPVRVIDEPDVRRRWAAARVEEIALRGKGREAATDVALRAGLLTPWTGWIVGRQGVYAPTPFQTRVLDLASDPDAAGFAAVLSTPRAASGSLTDALHALHPAGGEGDGEDEYEAAVATAARRVIDGAGNAIRACRDSRAALRPELSGNLSVTLALDGEGRAGDVTAQGFSGAGDPALERCVEVVVQGLTYPASGLNGEIKVSVTISLPQPRATLRGRKCSATSTLPLPLRRGVWRERLERAAPEEVYLEAKRSCELPTWTDRRALLELIMTVREGGMARVDLARKLAQAGDDDAAALLRREAVRRARSPEELRQVRLALIGDEKLPERAFRKRYGEARTDEARLAVVRRFLSIAPHDARLRLRLLALLESLGMKQPLADEVRRIRRDPFAEASLLAEGASALRRIGDEAEARRAFGELAERAPADPWARAFLGDRLRNEGWFDDAAAAYSVLDQLLPGDPAAVLRLALAHAGAGRLDVAQRMLARVAQTGGRTGDGQLGELAGRVAAALLAEALGKEGVGKDDLDRLTRAALELPLPITSTLVLVRGPAGVAPIEAVLVRGPKDAREERPPEIAAPSVGVASLRIDPGDTSEMVLRLRRQEELSPARPTRVRVDALVPKGKGQPVGIVSTEVDLPASGEVIEVKWDGARWGAG
ncbi:MAG: VWA domain-containing protein [Polyangiaceae bacterium]|nr:VWA domain-containing protein [Polyangiaceae bacterium]